MISLHERKEMIQTASGLEPLDVLIENVQVVNVHTACIENGSLGIKNGRIITAYAQQYQAEQIIDGKGRFALPGFMDTHVHLDSTLVTPENLSSLIVPHGTTAMLADPMEIANVAGLPGFKLLLQSHERLPYHIFIEVSSRVPTAPGMETTGGVMGLDEVVEVLNWENTVSLGELDPSKVLGLMDEYLLKVQAALSLGKICNGHAVGRTGKELTAYACGGLTDDHECVDYEEALTRLNSGMAVLIREGSTERNLKLILQGFVRNGYYPPTLMFCTDDKHPDDILEEGHIDFMINQAIDLGVPPITAIQMATINAARHFRIDHIVGSLTPGRWADIVLTDNIEHIEPVEVWAKGKPVFSNGQLTSPIPASDYPDWIKNTIHISRGSQAEDFALRSDEQSPRVWVIDLYPDQIINKKLQAVLSTKNGLVQPDVQQDIIKLSVVERHGKNGNIGTAFVKGFGIKNGALASSVCHDHHNIIIAGTNDEDMAACVRKISEMQGGLCISSNGKILGSLPLPVGGLLSEQPVDDIIISLNHITAIYHDLNGILPAPFMTLSFIGLPTVPELGLTDKGLVDVLAYKLISPFVDKC